MFYFCGLLRAALPEGLSFAFLLALHCAVLSLLLSIRFSDWVKESISVQSDSQAVDVHPRLRMLGE